MKIAHHPPARLHLIETYQRPDDYPPLTEALVVELIEEKIAFYRMQIAEGIENRGAHCLHCQVAQCEVILLEIKYYYGNRYYDDAARAAEAAENERRETIKEQ